MKENIILFADSYKYSHYMQYPKNTTYIHSYLEARGSNIEIDYTVFFGLSYYIQKYFMTPIDKEMINEASTILKDHGLPFNNQGFEYIISNHNGYLPVRIRAVKEGVKIGIKNVLLTIESTDPKCVWVVNFVETLILKIWYPITVATISSDFKNILDQYVKKTSDNEDIIKFMLHDFGYRGVSSEQSAMIGGMSHLVNFESTDTVAALRGHKKYYDEKMAGYSIPATEHSTMTCYGLDEEKAFLKMINLFKNDYTAYSIVADSYDYFNAIEIFCSLKDEIISGKGKLVIRPDSGDAIKNIIYTLERLKDTFGYVLNKKGFIVLNNVGIIQGDGVNKKDIVKIISVLEENNYAADNIVFGMGGSLLQGNMNSDLNRDTFRFAIKTSCVIIDGEFKDVVKIPKTDLSKISKKGRLDLVKNDEFETIVLENKENHYAKNSEMVIYYDSGKMLYNPSLKEIRENTRS